MSSSGENLSYLVSGVLGVIPVADEEDDYKRIITLYEVRYEKDRNLLIHEM